ncbi:polyketide synthase [Pochonia chlamydosporia 170]|uniref:Polyketide synthase n=1 Tax=Pochonia chlamydosporia 170 TaxID=1380566 RepID=A0A179F8P7_METCM|nr:polyketide synthase [Pochonia chlamydosporia 170]OAQ61798.1 polyketide synthase [Pochonia chlamydosporia 170]
MAFKEPAFRHALAATGVDPGILSNRISHVFNLRGPSAVINTACSSSLYAIHNACTALRNQECSAAVVGGVNLVLTIDQHMNTAKLGVLSKTSTSHTFDASADGYGRAEGVGAVYLKRLRGAIRDGDAIRGVLRSSATNYNGKIAGAGITTPNIEGQEAVVRNAYLRGGNLDVRLTGLFECHGTGTVLGDPLEVEAISKAMNKNRRDDDDPLILGAVKPSIGHGEAVSGLSALIKAVLAVERGIIPPTRGVMNPTPVIKWDAWRVSVSHDPQFFPSKLPIKRVSVNAFGYGGTNAHVIVESADSILTLPQTYKYRHMNRSAKSIQMQTKAERSRPYLLAFSAHDSATLRRNIQALGGVVRDYDLLDVAYTLANRRTRFNSRGVVVASSETAESEFSQTLQTFDFLESKFTSKKPTLGFVFTGQGAQWARMGAELLAYYPSFAHTIRFLDTTLGLLPDGPLWTIEELLLESAETSHVNEAEFAQPLCTAVQVALVKLLQGWNVRPRVCIGHSSGEIAAAFTSGLISSADAIVAAYYRGKVMRDVGVKGAMLAVGLGAEDVAPYLKDLHERATIACHNSPSSVTLSGDSEAIEEIRLQLDAEQRFARVLKTNGKAYHSSHMAAVSTKYEELMKQARGKYETFEFDVPGHAFMVSSVHNTVLPASTRLDEKYWSKNLLSPVLFNQAMQTVATSTKFSDVDLFIEIGPHPALSGPIRQIKAACQLGKLNYLPSLVRNRDSAASLLKLAGELFLRNHDIDMRRVAGIEEMTGSGQVVLKTGCFITDLPTYQWDKTKEYLAESRMSKEH